MSWRGDLKTQLPQRYSNTELKMLVETELDDPDLSQALPAVSSSELEFVDALVDVLDQRDQLGPFLEAVIRDKPAHAADFQAILRQTQRTAPQRLLDHLRHVRRPRYDTAAVVVPALLALLGVADRFEVPARARLLSGGPALDATSTAIISLAPGRPPSALRPAILPLARRAADRHAKAIVLAVARDTSTDPDPAFCAALAEIDLDTPVIIAVRQEGQYALPDPSVSCVGVDVGIADFREDPWFGMVIKAPVSIVRPLDGQVVYHAAVSAVRLAQGGPVPVVHEGWLQLGPVSNPIEGGDIYLARTQGVPRVREDAEKGWSILNGSIVLIGVEGGDNDTVKVPAGTVSRVEGLAQLVETIAQQRAPVPVSAGASAVMTLFTSIAGLLAGAVVPRRLALASAAPPAAVIVFAMWNARNGYLHSLTPLLLAGVLTVLASLRVRRQA